jgi:hypothetical protein
LLGNKISKKKSFKKKSKAKISGSLNSYDMERPNIIDWWGEEARVIIRKVNFNKIYSFFPSDESFNF